MAIVDDDPIQEAPLRAFLEQKGWDEFVRLVRSYRDAREKKIVEAVNGFLQERVDADGPDATVSVVDVRARLFEVPQ